MKYETAILLIAFFGLSSAAPVPAKLRREVPQEHSHEKFLTSVRASLNLNNPNEIGDPIFGLLGNGAAAEGAGQITNLDCLHQATADQAFTNAKAAGDIEAMSDALVYAALERNTGSVGLKSVLCTDQAENPEIQAISQHQDPASEGAAAENKAITLEVAKQIASIGGDPQLALQSGTFAPGELGDPTGAGNTCNELDDPEGCIFTQNLLVEDASAAEIDAAAGGAADAGGNAAENENAEADDAVADAQADDAQAGNAHAGNGDAIANAGNNEADAEDEVATITAGVGAAGATACPAPVTVTVTKDAAPTAAAGNAEADAGNNADDDAGAGEAATGTNVQTFTGTLGGAAPAVESSAGARPFSVNGATFVNEGAALQRSCAVQNNACANAINSGAIDGSVSDCNAQEKQCLAAASASAKVRRQGLDLGSCSDATIEFSSSLPDRSGSGFIASNLNDFAHGSALNINVISSFICSQLESKCKASAEAIAACKAGQTAAGGATGQAAADAFNAALGA